MIDCVWLIHSRIVLWLIDCIPWYIWNIRLHSFFPNPARHSATTAATAAVAAAHKDDGDAYSSRISRPTEEEMDEACASDNEVRWYSFYLNLSLSLYICCTEGWWWYIQQQHQSTYRRRNGRSVCIWSRSAVMIFLPQPQPLSIYISLTFYYVYTTVLQCTN